jgi:hypothetical protein
MAARLAMSTGSEVMMLSSSEAMSTTAASTMSAVLLAPRRVPVAFASSLGEGQHVDARDGGGEASLPSGSSPPGLGEDPGVGAWRLSAEQSRLQTDPHRPVTALEGDEPSGVADKGHAAPGR